MNNLVRKFKFFSKFSLLVTRKCSNKPLSTAAIKQPETTKTILSTPPLGLASPWEKIGWATDPETEESIKQGVAVFENFASVEEESSILSEVEPYLKRLKYEDSHWDDAIKGFRETERKSWTAKNRSLIERIQKISFTPSCSILPHVHVLDLLPSGVIKAHVDSVKFCGDTITGLCLLSSCVMRFVNVNDQSKYADVLLPRYCLYYMKNAARYKFTHEVLPNDLSKFKGVQVERSRRIVVLCRNKPVVNRDGGFDSVEKNDDGVGSSYGGYSKS